MEIDKEDPGIRLGRLARLKGIELEYHDIRGRIHRASEETLKALLRAMGLKVDRPEEIETGITREEQRGWRRLTSPVLVENLSRVPEELMFQIPAPEGAPIEEWVGDLQIQMAIEEENGCQRIRVFSLEEIQIRESGQVDKVRFQRFGIPFPTDLPLGVHRLRLTVSSAEKTYDQVLTLILCPDKAYKPPVLRAGGRRAGLAVALHGLRSLRNWGIGDLGDLKTLCRWAGKELKVDLIGLLPLHALGNREPYNISPYYPSSRFYRNYVYLDVPDIEEVKTSSEIQEWVGSAEVQHRIEALRNSDGVEYEAAAGLKLQVLEKAFQSFLKKHGEAEGPESSRLKAFQSFRQREGEFLERFAVYCTLEESFRRRPPFPQIWQDWPAPFQDPNSEEVQEFKAAQAERVLFHQYLQWQLEEQLLEVQAAARDSGVSIGLYFDLALGVNPSGADAWAYRDFFIPEIRAGAPPDDFSPLGQDWGFNPPDRDKHRADGYRVLKHEFRKNCFPGGALRIDHVMKYGRLFWIPQGRKPSEGAYVRDFFADLVRILALESNRSRTLIIGEDLGTVPEEIREVLNRQGVFSYRLFYFEKDAGGNFKNPEDYPRKALAAISTHDLPTLAGFWSLKDIQIRKDLGLFPNEKDYRAARLERLQDKRKIIDLLYRNGFLNREAHRQLHAQEIPEVTPELHQAVIGFLVSTPAKLVVLNQEDLFLEMDQQNLPGTTRQYPNWKRKMRFSLEELAADPRARELAGRYRVWIEKSGRGNYSKV